MASANDALRQAVDAKAGDYYTYASNYRELRDIYQSEHPKNWKSELIGAIARETGTQASSVRRQVNRYEAFLSGSGKQARNPDRAGKSTREAFEKVGRQQEPLKRDAPPGGLTITVSGKQGSGRKERTREFKANMDYQTAVQFVQNPNLVDLFDFIYPDWPDAVAILFGDDSGALSGTSFA